MDRHLLLFELIAPFYKFFYAAQKKRFEKFTEKILGKDGECRTFFDMGFGTGALLDVLHEKGYPCAGVDGANRMVKIARKKLAGKPIRLLHGDFTEGIPIEDDSHTCVVSSFVAHGLKYEKRKKLYAEAKRIATNKVFLIEHSEDTMLLLKLSEVFEGGEYFRFIKQAEKELKRHFSSLEVIRLTDNIKVFIMDV